MSYTHKVKKEGTFENVCLRRASGAWPPVFDTVRIKNEIITSQWPGTNTTQILRKINNKKSVHRGLFRICAAMVSPQRQ